MRMRTAVAALMVISAALGLGGCEKNDNDNMNNADREFMERMARSNNAGVELGNLAASDGSDATVKSYGQAMASEHSSAMNELKTMAQQRNYGLPSGLDVEHVALKVTLEGKSGRSFDSIYIKGQVHDHDELEGIFQDEIADGKDEGLKSYARKYKPKEATHRTTAQGIVEAMDF